MIQCKSINRWNIGSNDIFICDYLKLERTERGNIQKYPFIIFTKY